MMWNAIGISGKSANKLHINFLFNEFRSELASISPVISCNGGKLFTESNEQQIILKVNCLLRAISSEFESVRRIFALLLITFMDKNAFSHVNVISKWNITRANFRSSGKFKVVRSPEMNHIRNTRDWTEGTSFKLRFQYWICFEVNDFPLVRYWHFHILLFTK